MQTPRWITAFLACACTLQLAQSAFAAPGRPDSSPTSPAASHEPSQLSTQESAHGFHDQIAVKAVGGGVFAHTPEAVAGMSALYEHEVLADWLEVELGGAVLVGPHTGVVAVDLLAKHTFWHGAPIDVFVAAGPAVGLEVALADDGLWSVHPLLMASAGGHWWVTSHFGVLVEADAGFDVSRAAPVELETAVGLAYRF